MTERPAAAGLSEAIRAISYPEGRGFESRPRGPFCLRARCEGSAVLQCGSRASRRLLSTEHLPQAFEKHRLRGVDPAARFIEREPLGAVDLGELAHDT